MKIRDSRRSVDVSIGPLSHEDKMVIFRLNDLSAAFSGLTIVRPSFNEDELFIRMKDLEYLFNRLGHIVEMDAQDVSGAVSPF